MISGIAFSQPFFEPSLGQTQQVTATFAANVDWTLQIVDESSNAVRTVTGSGISLKFNWDGTGNGGTNIPDSVYYYLISAQTNGRAYQNSGSDSYDGGSENAPLPSLATTAFGESADSTELLAMPADGSGSIVPFALYPPGIDTNNLIIFEGSMADLRPHRMSSFAVQSSAATDYGSSYSGASSQNTAAPVRPPTSPVKNSVGSVGVAYFDFKTTKTYPNPLNGMPLPGNGGKVQIEGSYGGVMFTNMPDATACANNFVARMRKKGWWGASGFNFSGSTIRLNDLRSASLGGNEIFGNVNLGLFIDHGNYGTSLDYNSYANWSYETYMASDNPSDSYAPWLRLSEFGMGGNLRWMAILACNILRDQNYNSMVNQGVFPLKENTHLLCGASTFAFIGEDIGGYWAEYMTRSILAGGQKTVRQSWYDAGRKQYSYGTNLTGSIIIFRVVGWDNCMDDKLNNYAGGTSGTIAEDHQQVFP